ncbi:MAG TPA: outer membrane beta-barrel family protein, partial [Chitinophaga sp.]|uniref:outer membrane beta-barrel family protein n=1 Tax=Chitinophaga sp. TaxID=1869181 RepID=UPI002BE50446
TNPSSAYEAQGSAGIINIILKKNEMQGCNASVQASLGSPASNGINVNMSYKTQKVNLFSNIGYRYINMIVDNTLYKDSRNKGQQSILEQHGSENSSAGTTSVYIGGDYYINAKNTLTGSYYRSYNVNKDDNRYYYNYFTNNRKDSTVARLENYREPQIFNELELNYVKTFNQPGLKWTTNLQYDFWNDDEHQNIRQQRSTPEGPLSQIITRDIESSNDIFIQSDFTTPLKKSGRLDAGIKGNLRAIRSEYSASQDNVALEQYNNKLMYDENIYAAYIQYSNKISKLNYLVGLRSELSDIHISDRKGTLDKRKNYLDLFPTLHLQYQLQPLLDLQLSYSRRVNRPKFWQLNSFAGLSNDRYLTVGNPDLNPIYTHSIEAGVLKKTGRLSINPGAYFQYSTNYFEFILQETDKGNVLRTPVNLDHETRYGAELTTSWNPYTWWRLSLDLNFYKFSQEGAFEGKNYYTTDQTWFSTLRSGMKFPKIVSVDFSFNYQGQKNTVQSVIRPNYRANIALSKDLLQDRASITFAVNNLLNSQTYEQITAAQDYYLNVYYKRVGPTYLGAITYRLNRKKDQADRLPTEK